jgi:hypothetical protein
VPGLAINLVGDDKRILPEAAHAFIHSLQQMLQHDTVRRFWRRVTSSLSGDIHRARDHSDIPGCDSLYDIIEDANACPYGHAIPCPVGVEDLMTVEFRLFV